MEVWALLKAYVHEFEIANQVKFSDEAWQRIHQLDADIERIISDNRKEVVDLYEQHADAKGWHS